MATQGPNYSATQVDTMAPFAAPWVNISNLGANDGSYATALLSSGASDTDFADTTNYGFSIPAGATINGVTVEISRKVSTAASNTEDEVVQLIKGGTALGNNKATVTNYTTSDVIASYGSVSDLWGLALTPTDVNSSTFGARFQVQDALAGSLTLSADFIRITITYTNPQGGFNIAFV